MASKVAGEVLVKTEVEMVTMGKKRKNKVDVK